MLVGDLVRNHDINVNNYLYTVELTIRMKSPITSKETTVHRILLLLLLLLSDVGNVRVIIEAVLLIETITPISLL